MPWTLKGLLRAASVDAATDRDAEIAGIAHDSRAVKAGDLFCCVPGLVVDGHDSSTATTLPLRPPGPARPRCSSSAGSRWTSRRRSWHTSGR
jgi:hypothetical protein